MSDLDLTEIRALCERMPKGPWRMMPSHVVEGPSEVRVADGWLLCTTSADDYAAFIAAVRTLVPQLCDEVAKYQWNRDLSAAPYDVPLLLACSGVRVGKRVGNFDFVSPSNALLRPSHWMRAPDMPKGE